MLQLSDRAKAWVEVAAVGMVDVGLPRELLGSVARRGGGLGAHSPWTFMGVEI